MHNLLEILIFTLKNFTKLPILRYLGICNVLHIWHIRAIPTYRVYRLYDIISYGVWFSLAFMFIQSELFKWHFWAFVCFNKVVHKFSIKLKNFSCCTKGDFYANPCLLHKGKILCQVCLGLYASDVGKKLPYVNNNNNINILYIHWMKLCRSCIFCGAIKQFSFHY